jgi:hypothetical protein
VSRGLLSLVRRERDFVKQKCERILAWEQSLNLNLGIEVSREWGDVLNRCCCVELQRLPDRGGGAAGVREMRR